MKKADPYRVVFAYTNGLRTTKNLPSNIRTAGEVRHVKDNTGDASTWAYSMHHPLERELVSDFKWDSSEQKMLARILRSATASLGHAISAQNNFARIKSRKVSPDGRLGGKGYIMKVMDIRRQFFNIVEALSAIIDTLYDEVNAPHWSLNSRDPETDRILEHTDEIKDNPEAWAKEEIEEDADQRTE